MDIKKKLILPLVITSFALSSCNIFRHKPDEKPLAEFTILMYMAGSDLESSLVGARMIIGNDNELYEWNMCGEATNDIREILSVPNKPDDVNIVIMTGGSPVWTPTEYGEYGDYDIDGQLTQIHHVTNEQKIELDVSVPHKDMGYVETLQYFLEYGLTNYPARRTGLILWGHGGGLSGVCLDTAYQMPLGYYDRLHCSEISEAVGNALENTGHKGEKLEFLGFDACLMAVQDIIDFNSKYFKYVVCTPEPEAGYGWDYDTWVDDLYLKKATTDILKEICDGYVKSYIYDLAGNYQNALNYGNNHSMAYFNLSRFELYKEAWEAMSAQITFNNDNIHAFNDFLLDDNHGVKTYGYGYFDALDFVDKLKANTTFSGKPADSYLDAVRNAYSNLGMYIKKGQAISTSTRFNGLSVFFPYMTYTDSDMWYDHNESNFSNWLQVCVDYLDIWFQQTANRCLLFYLSLR